MRDDIVAQIPIDTRRLRHPVIQQLYPLFRALVMRHGAQQVVCLHDDFERIAEVVGEPANLFSLLCGNGTWVWGHRAARPLLVNLAVITTFPQVEKAAR
jgi:hypothetical protein